MSEKKTIPEYMLSDANGGVVDSTSIEDSIRPERSGSAATRDVVMVEPAVGACERLPEIVLYEHANWGGASAQTSLNWNYVGNYWNDKVSSIVVIGGTWRLYEHRDFTGKYWDYGPGQYAKIPNDRVSSFQLIRGC